MAEQTELEILQAKLDASEKALAKANADKNAAEDAQLEAEQANQVLVRKLAERKDGSAPKLPKVEVDGEDYQFTCPRFEHNRKIYTAEEAKDDAEVCAHLVKIQSGILAKIG